ncbi:unnamed protein product [Caenorhabditis auriculariae]|uniref:Globin domain-containing protein n=1 Tax=Caenorhabditis auriculariae TaxID=2777116 RepID=A0A8S1H446_9PELO|nr:unnamed protein product [Caenorhabditis auriculariae]
MLKQKAASVKLPRNSKKSAMMSLSVPRTSRSLSPALARSAPTSPTVRHPPAEAYGSPNLMVRDRSGSISLSPRNVIPVCPQLTPSQVTVVKKSWRHINTKGLVIVLTRCFSRLQSNSPIATQCFQSATYSLSTNPNQVRSVADHAQYLLQLLDKIVEGDIDSEALREIGANHVSLKNDFGFSNQEWDRFQEIMVDVILKQDGVKQSKETSRAWRLLICSLVELMRDGFDATLRQYRRKHSFNAHTQYFEDIERSMAHCENPQKYFPIRKDAALRPGSLKGKVALITGGGTGLGRGMAEMFAELGAKVAIAARRLDILEKTAEEIKKSTGETCEAFQMDIKDRAKVAQSFDDIVKKFGEIPNILVNCAAGNFIMATERLSQNAYGTVIDIVMKGTLNVTTEFGRRCIDAKKGGVVLSITTPYARAGAPFVVPSAVSKAGVETMTKSLAVEWAKYGLRFNVIAPGPIPTEGAFGRLNSVPMEVAVEATKYKVPLGRCGEIEELANLAAFMCSDHMSWLNGAIIDFDGGQQFMHHGTLPAGALKGKVALITGGGTGLGKAMATTFSRLGASVAIAARRFDVLEKTAAEIHAETGGKVEPFKLDVRNAELVKGTFDQISEKFGEIPNILVNNAAGNFIGATQRLSPNAISAVIDIVLKGSLNVTTELGRRAIKQGRGAAVLSISTPFARAGAPFVVPSAVSKAGVETMTRSLANEWAKYGLRFNVIAPGPIPTEGAYGRLSTSSLEDTEKTLNQSVPVGRCGRPEELANLAAFIVSDYMSWMNGSIVDFDGGQQFMHHGSSFGEFLHDWDEKKWEEAENLIRGRSGKSK